MQPRVIGLNGVVLDMERILRRVLGEHVVLRTRLEPELGPCSPIRSSSSRW